MRVDCSAVRNYAKATSVTLSGIRSDGQSTVRNYGDEGRLYEMQYVLYVQEIFA